MGAKSDMDLLVAILDQLIPPNTDRGIPGAGELGLAEVLSSPTGSPELKRAIKAIMTAAANKGGEVTTETVRELEFGDPEAFGLLLSETYKAYYSRSDMREKVGVGAHPVHPDGYEVAPEDPALIGSLVAPVRERGPVYRDPTDGAGDGDGA